MATLNEDQVSTALDALTVAIDRYEHEASICPGVDDGCVCGECATGLVLADRYQQLADHLREVPHD